MAVAGSSLAGESPSCDDCSAHSVAGVVCGLVQELEQGDGERCCGDAVRDEGPCHTLD